VAPYKKENEVTGNIFKMVFLLSSLALAKWAQDDFVIMSNYDPTLTGNITADEASLIKFKGAYFNLLSGHNDNQGDVGYQFRAAGPSQEYKLTRVASVGGLRSLVSDYRTFYAGRPYLQGEMANLVNDYKTLLSPQSLRNVIYGYNFQDEPSIDHLKNLVLPRINDVSPLEPNMLLYENLGGSWRGKAKDSDPDNTVTWANYNTYLDQYFNNTATSVASFDYYLFEAYMSNNGYFRFPPGPLVTYFKHMQIFADKAALKGKTFWGTPLSVTHTAGGRNYIIPSEDYVRYYAFSNLIYGAKGLVWFTYGLPGPRVGESYFKAPENDAVMLSWLTNVNRDVSTMGPILMGLTWSKTVHSSETDIYSGETGLAVFSSSNIFSSTNPIQFTCSTCSKSFAAGVFKSSGDDYLLFLNKNVLGSTPSTTSANITLQGNVSPKYLNMASKTFERFSSTYNATANTTTFGLSIKRGDGVLIWIDKGTQVPVLQEILF
jgi:hypothetical protein